MSSAALHFQRKKARLTALAPKVATIDTRRVALPVKTADPFYSSPEYLRWRDIVIARAGGYCQDPACKTPHRQGIRLFADHIIEIKDGGARLDPANGLARCGSCHSRKTAHERAERMKRPVR